MNTTAETFSNDEKYLQRLQEDNKGLADQNAQLVLSIGAQKDELANAHKQIEELKKLIEEKDKTIARMIDDDGMLRNRIKQLQSLPSKMEEAQRHIAYSDEITREKAQAQKEAEEINNAAAYFANLKF